MDFNDYQEAAGRSAVYPERGKATIYPNMAYVVSGLAGEAGEVSEKFKKIIRDIKPCPTKKHQIPNEVREAIIKELGDVLWYVSQVAHELRVPLSVVAERNIIKLTARDKKGTLHGEGDDR